MRHLNMKFQFHPSYDSALSWAICLQAVWFALLYFGTYDVLPIFLIPAMAYWIITPIVILRHPQPTKLDLQMVRVGYFVYCLLLFLGGGVYAAWRCGEHAS
jgi:hypothetical protein